MRNFYFSPSRIIFLVMLVRIGFSPGINCQQQENSFQLRKSFSSCGSGIVPENDVDDDYDLIEGDIMVSKEDKSGNSDPSGWPSKGLVGSFCWWTDGIVPYKISRVYNSSETATILTAIKDIQRKSGDCLTFKLRTNEKNYILIKDGRGCSSQVGMQLGLQPVTLDRYRCLSHGQILHELMHAAGFYHEHSRHDRDKFLDVKKDNIQPDALHNFVKYKSIDGIHDIPYDTNSVLHYSEYAFAARRGRPTLVVKQPEKKIGQREYLSKIDIRKIRDVYCAIKNKKKNLKSKASPLSSAYNSVLNKVKRLF